MDETAAIARLKSCGVIPVVVISELEGKRHDPEIGYFARQALRYLDELRVEHGRLDFAVPVGEGAMGAIT